MLRTLTLAALAALSLTCHAQAPVAAGTAAPLTDGEVRQVDKAAGKITLRHGPIVNLDMPAMTMAFRVADPAWLDQLKEGDKLRFYADRINGVITVTNIAPPKP